MEHCQSFTYEFVSIFKASYCQLLKERINLLTGSCTALCDDLDIVLPGKSLTILHGDFLT